MSSKKTPMTTERARIIQSDADREDHNQEFKRRAMIAAERKRKLDRNE